MEFRKDVLAFLDPPYGLGAKKSFNQDHPDYEDDKPFDLTKLQLPFEWVIWGANYYDWLPMPRTEIGWIVWDKRPTRENWDQETRESADRRFGQHFEIAVTNVSELRGKIIRKTWGGFYGTAGKPEDTIIHKTQKPIELIEICLQPRHKIVLDYFLGSGSTIIACEKTKRKCYGMEIDPHYCDVIIARWENFTGKKAEMVK
jgi:DNA modification methylase